MSSLPPDPNTASASGRTRHQPEPAAPSPNGGNGRDTHGRFTRGNRGGPGNPFAKRIAAFRSAIFRIVTEEDVQGIVYVLLQRARTGDVASIKLLFTYVLGRPEPE